MSLYPLNPAYGQTMQTGAGQTHVVVDLGFIAHLKLDSSLAMALSNTGVHAAVTDNGAQQVVTTAISNPPYARNITATAGGTGTDIKAIQVTIVGTDIDNQPLTEVLPAFTLDTPGTVQGSKAFKTVTSITIPAHDGLGATTAIGFGNKIGLPDKLAHNTVLFAFLSTVKEATAPTVAFDEGVLPGNTVLLNSALNGTPVDIYYVV